MKNFFKLINFLVLAAVLASCGKEQGCTDYLAVNYSLTAEEDDGSCNYSGRAYAYYSYTASSNFEDDFITDLNIFMDNELAGTMEADAGVVTVSGCYASGNVSRTFDLGSAKSKNFLLRVENAANGDILYATEFQVLAGIECNPVEIIY